MQQASWAERPEEDIREKEKLIAELRQQIEAHREALTRGTVPEFMRELYLTEMMDMRKEIVELQRRLHLKEQMASRARWAEGGETSSSAPGHGEHCVRCTAWWHVVGHILHMGHIAVCASTGTGSAQ